MRSNEGSWDGLVLINGWRSKNEKLWELNRHSGRDLTWIEGISRRNKLKVNRLFEILLYDCSNTNQRYRQ